MTIEITLPLDLTDHHDGGQPDTPCTATAGVTQVIDEGPDVTDIDIYTKDDYAVDFDELPESVQDLIVDALTTAFLDLPKEERK